MATVMMVVAMKMRWEMMATRGGMEDHLDLVLLKLGTEQLRLQLGDHHGGLLVGKTLAEGKVKP